METVSLWQMLFRSTEFCSLKTNNMGLCNSLLLVHKLFIAVNHRQALYLRLTKLFLSSWLGTSTQTYHITGWVFITWPKHESSCFTHVWGLLKKKGMREQAYADEFFWKAGSSILNRGWQLLYALFQQGLWGYSFGCSIWKCLKLFEITGYKDEIYKRYYKCQNVALAFLPFPDESNDNLLWFSL